jgi:hypothetical protein
MPKPLARNSLLVRIIKKTMVPWYLVTTLLYMAAIPMTIFVFPSTTLLLTIFVLFGGFTASMASLASALVSAEQEENLEAEQAD